MVEQTVEEEIVRAPKVMTQGRTVQKTTVQSIGMSAAVEAQQSVEMGAVFMPADAASVPKLAEKTIQATEKGNVGVNEVATQGGSVQKTVENAVEAPVGCMQEIAHVPNQEMIVRAPKVLPPRSASSVQQAVEQTVDKEIANVLKPKDSKRAHARRGDFRATEEGILRVPRMDTKGHSVEKTVEHGVGGWQPGG